MSQENVLYDLEKTSLETHVSLCAERYKRLEDKFEHLEGRLDKLCEDVESMSDKNDKNMNELKTIIQTGNDNRFKAIVAGAATVIAALVSAVAYIVSRMP